MSCLTVPNMTVEVPLYDAVNTARKGSAAPKASKQLVGPSDIQVADFFSQRQSRDHHSGLERVS